MPEQQSSDHVVLLHGLGRTRLSMSVLQRKLSSAGYRVHNFGYQSLRFPIAEQASRLHTFLEERVSEGDTLHFVTHSLGSIIARRYALDRRHQFRLGRAVMLGPPNQGSSFAEQVSRVPIIRTVMGPALLELRSLELEPATDLLEVGIIAGGTETKKGYSPLVEGDNDGLVAVRETHLDGARDEILIRGLHTFLMYSPTIFHQVLHFLEHACFDHEISSS